MFDKAYLKDYLDECVYKYNTPEFIDNDPISLPHQFTKKEDIEIIGFLVATFAWGNRAMILKNGEKLLQISKYEPHNFILDFNEKMFLKSKADFNHRTFFIDDLRYFFKSLNNIYTKHNGLESCFNANNLQNEMHFRISNFRKIFFELPHLQRTEKHVSNPIQNSACKRINMFLRWMVRKDNCGVDFGIWDSMKPSQLLCPLDIHSGRIARKLEILIRKQDDWKATIELTNALKEFDINDPIKYDFALFGLGVNKEFQS
jgi:uncharacterized protein (TIGR02757 family)